MSDVLKEDKDPFGFSLLDYVSTRQQSIELNKREGAFVVIAGSGMCENGRIRHHLKNGLEHPENTIVLMGYQAEHTLGRRLQQRDPKVKIFDRYYQVKAKVVQLSGLSGHADVEALNGGTKPPRNGETSARSSSSTGNRNRRQRWQP